MAKRLVIDAAKGTAGIICAVLLILVLFEAACTYTEKVILEQTVKPVQNIISALNISILSTNSTSMDCYFDDPGVLAEIDPLFTDMPNISEFYQALNKLPVSLMQVMRNKTFYLSYQYGRSYAILGSWPEYQILANAERGCILEQPISESRVIHEFAHILDYHGIRGIYEDLEAQWTHLESRRSEIFGIHTVLRTYDYDLHHSPAGFISEYAKTNAAEDFAEHFTAYILKGEKFRNLAVNDQVLGRKYNFFKNMLFDGKEYPVFSVGTP
jgi:hypothetical protein